LFKGTVKEKWAELKKSSRLSGLAPALLGAFVLLNSLDRPGVEALHGSDVIRLVASGMGLGIGLVGLMGMLKFPNSGTNQK
jgi:hypothetical protein